ncbi:hypothetical protein E2C01_046245 [Portunus trituberculatus]|uniref:Uncharacterized protein n=1 Tax=Portunus trituberculatus TaxID=210409 RepID=A0A5B7G458_PORTR|nr:hypothetical protein [Portunus trituberculatus]
MQRQARDTPLPREIASQRRHQTSMPQLFRPTTPGTHYCAWFTSSRWLVTPDQLGGEASTHLCCSNTSRNFHVKRTKEGFPSWTPFHFTYSRAPSPLPAFVLLSAYCTKLPPAPYSEPRPSRGYNIDATSARQPPVNTNRSAELREGDVAHHGESNGTVFSRYHRH